MEPAADINPYAASPVSDARTTVAEPRPEPERHYQVRMSWTARRNFLRAVGPLRLYGVAGMVFGASGLFGLLSSGYQIWEFSQAEGLAALGLMLRLALNFVRATLVFYICWLCWKLADALATTAGGSTGEMVGWSRFQLRLAQANLALMAAVAVPFVWDWLSLFLWNTAFTP
jgi:hypothetical protein